MKIDSIVITLRANETEKEAGYPEVISLYRSENKLWSCPQQIGLYPYQIKLADDIQKVIKAFNGNEKNE